MLALPVILWSRFIYLGVTTYLVVTERPALSESKLFTGPLQEMLCRHESLWIEGEDVLTIKFYQTDGKKRETGLQKGEVRSSQGFWKGNNNWMFWKATCLVRNPLKTFFTALGQDERCCRKRKLCCHSSLGWWEHKKLRFFSLFQTSEFGQVDSTLKSEFAALFDHFRQFANLGNTQRYPHHVFERKKVHILYLWSQQQSPQSRFSSLFLINLWKKTRDSDILQRRLRKKKIYNPSGRSLSSISHEDLTVFSCEAGNGVLFFYCSSDRRRLGFCVGLT